RRRSPAWASNGGITPRPISIAAASTMSATWTPSPRLPFAETGTALTGCALARPFAPVLVPAGLQTPVFGSQVEPAPVAPLVPVVPFAPVVPFVFVPPAVLLPPLLLLLPL